MHEEQRCQYMIGWGRELFLYYLLNIYFIKYKVYYILNININL
jgi:hypothetical protein